MDSSQATTGNFPTTISNEKWSHWYSMQTTICPWKLPCGETCTRLASFGCTSADPKALNPLLLQDLRPLSSQVAKSFFLNFSIFTFLSFQQRALGWIHDYHRGLFNAGHPSLSFAHPRKLYASQTTHLNLGQGKMDCFAGFALSNFRKCRWSVHQDQTAVQVKGKHKLQPKSSWWRILPQRLKWFKDSRTPLKSLSKNMIGLLLLHNKVGEKRMLT